MASFGEAIGDSVRVGLCGVLAGAGMAEDFVRDIFDFPKADYGYRAKVLYSRYCDNPPPTPPLTAPYTGGQCPVEYRIQATVTDQPNDDEARITQIDLGFWGPIEGFSYGPSSSGISGGAYYITARGDVTVNPAPSAEPITEIFIETIFPPQRFESFLVEITNVFRADMLPDDCGDPPPPPPPDDPTKRVFPINFNFNYNDGTDFNITGNVFFGVAYVDANFNLNVPLSFQLNNNVQFNANFNFDSGDITFNFGDEFDFPKPPLPDGDYRTDPDDPSPPPTNSPPPSGFNPPFPPTPPGNEDGDDFDDGEPQQDPKIRRVVGVLVDVLTPASFSTELGQLENPDVYIPDVGLVNFGYLIDGNKFYWGEDVRVKNRRQVIFTPSGRFAVTVSGTPRGNTVWNLTPIYAEVKSGVGA